MQQLLVVNSILLWAVVLFNLLLSLALVRKLSGRMQMPSGLKAGVEAPNFSAQTLDGTHVTLANYLGKKVIFLFISPYCGACKEKMPEYQAMHSKIIRTGIELVLVNIAGTIDEVKTMIADFRITIPILLAQQDSNQFVKNYKVHMTPSYCLIGENGKVQSSGYPGDETGGEWKKLVEEWEGNAQKTIQPSLTDG